MRRIAIACALAALAAGLLVGLATAWSADGKRERSPRAQAFDSFLTDVARRLDVEPEELRSAIEGAALARVDRAAAAGRISESCADSLRERIRSGHIRPLFRAAKARPRGFAHRWRGEILERIRSRLDEAVEQGRITEQRAERILESVRTRFDRKRSHRPAHPCAQR